MSPGRRASAPRSLRENVPLVADDPHVGATVGERHAVNAEPVLRATCVAPLLVSQLVMR